MTTSDAPDLRRIATRGRLAIVACRAPDDVGLTADDGLQRGTVVVVVITDDDDTATVEDAVATASNPPDRGDAIGNTTAVLDVLVDVLTETCSGVVDVPPVDATAQFVSDFPTRTDEPWSSVIAA